MKVWLHYVRDGGTFSPDSLFWVYTNRLSADAAVRRAGGYLIEHPELPCLHDLFPSIHDGYPLLNPGRLKSE
jgi:hypothetical protein